ncbi:MAG: ABC transporter permease [Thermotogaceae bacterium]|nr:ABC transporter permease [Thermotogota bacterium]NLZ13504.1 ABC transporter permease [Thermotogaceae bacterium]MDD8040111.1 ABC transporter permease [Thermotogota bacterium]MDD8052912.1 ABC transporter permease [Thermotogota bacterium]HPB85938.1 ABC transporter permease [Thermotogota bacterium]
MIASYVFGRILSAIPTILILTFIVFLAIHLVPGDYIDIMLGTQNYLTDEQLTELYQQYGLDQPFVAQYGIWLKNLITFDFGTSLRTGQKVSALIVEKLPVTFELAFLALFFSLVFGIPLGITSAVKRNRFGDYVVRIFGLVGLSAPAFWIGAILIVAVSGLFQDYTLFGFVSLQTDMGKNLQILLIPSVTLGLMLAAQIMRMTRSSMLDVLSQEYVKVAKAKGVAKSKVIYRHALKNALIPVITTAGIQFGYLMGGTILMENMFALPGLGRLLLQSVNQRDYPVIQGIVLFIGVFIVLMNILVDILYTLIDPRIDLK